jgi:hypothetical protein
MVMTIRFSDLHGQLQVADTFTEETLVRDAVAAGVEKLGFPSHYDDGTPISYRARDVNSGALLAPEQHVGELEDDAVVQLIGEVPAA